MERLPCRFQKTPLSSLTVFYLTFRKPKDSNKLDRRAYVLVLLEIGSLHGFNFMTRRSYDPSVDRYFARPTQLIGIFFGLLSCVAPLVVNPKLSDGKLSVDATANIKKRSAMTQCSICMSIPRVQCTFGNCRSCLPDIA